MTAQWWVSSSQILLAMSIANEFHKPQKRKVTGEPYIVHPIEVAVWAYHVGMSEDACAAALLHDVPEDTPCTLEQLRSKGVNSDVIHLVRLMTKDWEDNAFGPEVTIKQGIYYTQISKDSRAVALKLLDRASNNLTFIKMLEMKMDPRKFHDMVTWAHRYAKKSIRDISPLRKYCIHQGAIALYDEKLQHLEMEVAKHGFPVR